ncbi:Dynamitin subunit 2 [Penicillium brevicompactum]|uniref:Dynamitin subunit 2 n=1 Tax=Penicillium brevicompactum TaxID=5074 RepID=A0A9W9UM43_PENBR|nr:Dynamitin subunit 2 [Penicillium brevicompactum]
MFTLSDAELQSKMAFNKKYAGLPDLDPSPDIYETPDLTDEASTLPTGTIRTESDHDESSSDIDREGVNADQARLHFMGAAVDARDANFSDSISMKRQAYRSKDTNRRRKRTDGTEEVGDLSDSEDESVERRLARLRREVEDLKVEMANQKTEGDASQNTTEKTEDLGDGVAELSRALDNLHASRGATPSHSAAALLSQKLGSGAAPDAKTQASGTPAVASVEAPQPASAGILSHAAAFDSRLALLESSIGISNSSNPFVADGISDTTPHPVIPALDQLTSRLSALTGLLVGTNPTSGAPSGPGMTTPHLEALSTRVRKLTTDAEALTAARRKAFDAAKAAHNARLASSDADTPALDASADDEHTAKIQALYATLPTIQSLHPLLPSVLERLRSLRACHAGAAHAAESLDELEKRQAEMASEIEQWREGLTNVEEKMRQGEAALRSNVETVEPWVRDLEARLGRLETPGQ